MLFPIAAYCAYQVIFVRKNKFSDRYELKVFNRPFEMSVLGPLLTSRIKKANASIVYKQETQETLLVKQCLARLLDANFLRSLVPDPVVKVLHNEHTVAQWLCLDQTFFITITALKVAGMDEAKLALLVSHELAHYLMDHQVSRLLNAYFRVTFFAPIMARYSSRGEPDDPVKTDFRKRTRLQSFVCFYPQQRVVTKFVERNCDALALMLWTKAYPDVDHETLVSELYGEALDRHLRNVPHLDQRETFFSPEFSYKRAETVAQLLSKTLQQEKEKVEQVFDQLRKMEES